MENNMVISITGIAISIAGVLYTAINHKRIRSNCCGKVMEASIDIENTTPVNPENKPATS